MKLIDIESKIIITVTDETKGGMMYEEQMTLAEFFAKCVPDFQPEVVDAIPLEWLKACGKRGSIIWVIADILVERWRKEQEAR